MMRARFISMSGHRGRCQTAVAVASSIALVGMFSGTIPSANAQVSGVTGDVVNITGSLPGGVQECGTTGQSANNSTHCLSSPRAVHQIFAFDEAQSYVLPANLLVDFGPQSSNWALGTTYFTEAQILGHSYSLLAGDTVASHLLHTDLPYSDPAASSSDSTGAVFFSVIPQIYGLALTDARLGATDTLGVSTAGFYPSVDTNRGLEFDCPIPGTAVFTGITCSTAYNALTDSIEVGPTGELEVATSVTNGMDQIRVLTNVPDAPTITCPGPVTTTVGQVAQASGGTFADNDSFPTVTVTADRGTVTQVGSGRTGTWSWDLDTSLSLPSGPVTVTATDEQGEASSCTIALTVNEVVTAVVAPGGTIAVGGTKVTPANPTIAKLKLPKKVPPAAAGFSGAAFQAFGLVPGPSSSVSMALINSAADPDCIVGGGNVCFGRLVGVDPGPGHVSRSKPVKLTMTWVKDPRKDSRTSTLWVTKPIGSGRSTVRVPACQKVGKEYVNTPCLSKTSYPGGGYKVIVFLLSGDPKFGRR